MVNKLVKKIVILIGILSCFTIILLNIIFVSQIDNAIDEHVITHVNSILNILITGFLVLTIIVVSKITEKLSKNTKVAIYIIFIIIYIIAQIYWINIRQATPSWDQGEVYSIAVRMYENRWDELKNYQYLEKCPQQITIAATFYAIFKVFSTTSTKILQYANIISNVLTILAIMLITNFLDEKYRVNRAKTLILSGTFFTLPLLSTFIYGDLMSIPMCLFSIYFIMKYGRKNQPQHAIISALFIALGYLLRMNNLIFIIALVIYLILNILKEKVTIQKNVILVIFVVIAIVPATLIRSVLQDKLDLDKDKQIPTLGYLYMGMQEGSRANGWYNDYITWAWEDVEASKEKYKNMIIERVKYFGQNPGYFIKFYTKKITSMWTENTYASLWYNQTFNFNKIESETDARLDKLIRENTKELLIYQKALILVIFGTTIFVIIKNNKKLSNEIILLLTIFIGGFLFHILWEAKSRYIIPYILVLIPIASISIDSWKRESNKNEE